MSYRDAPDAVHVYQRPDTRGKRTPDPWCVTSRDGNIVTTTRHPDRESAELHAARLAGAKT